LIVGLVEKQISQNYKIHDYFPDFFFYLPVIPVGTAVWLEFSVKAAGRVSVSVSDYFLRPCFSVKMVFLRWVFY
jgi:hypothetical protein